MKTPNDTTTKTPRPAFWLRAIEHRKHELTREYRKGLGATAREGISDADYATTMATLEKMARNLGRDESQLGERGFGERPFGPRGFGHGPARGFGRGHRHPGMMRGHGPQRPSTDETPES